jgi:hypothetical protein
MHGARWTRDLVKARLASAMRRGRGLAGSAAVQCPSGHGGPPGIALEIDTLETRSINGAIVGEADLVAITEAVLGRGTESFRLLLLHCSDDVDITEYCRERGQGRTAFYEKINAAAGLVACFLNAQAVLREIDAGGTPREILRRIDRFRT